MKTPEYLGRKIATVGFTLGMAMGTVACAGSERSVQPTDRPMIETAYALDQIALIGAAKNTQAGINAINKGPVTFVTHEAQHDTYIPHDGAFIIDCVDKTPLPDATDSTLRFFEQPLLVIEIPTLAGGTATAIAQIQPELAKQVIDGTALTDVAACDKPATQYLPG